MDDYQYTSFDIPDEVDYLTARARRVSALVRQASAYQGTTDDWTRVTDVLGRMRRLLDGEDVDVPDIRDEYGDYDRDYGYLGRRSGGYDRPGILTGTQLQQFRDLASQVQQQAASALRTAEQSTSRYGRAQGIITELRGFADRAQELSYRTGRGEMPSADVATLVDGLLQDARDLDRRMRETRAFPDAWADWTGVIQTLDRASRIVR
jgi:hypothetical protein